ncbi:hypothetical protein QBC34DRAFT_382959 [Podospora aff. communis PSN243]|uniref:Secreted protein n=1 Tax=Podospora aff. communis PSN243 TaxID=3040156 RepID=A0AAV9GET6_9PEZI|nr:hypothetical protein QBC34DRAFT_382959 [Podospora aff. communis PSN243]
MTFMRLLAFAALVVAALAAPLADNGELIPGYKIVDLEWSVQAFPNGEYINVTGTVEEMIAHLNTINPDYEKNVLAAANMTQLAMGAGEHKKTGELEDGESWHTCFQQWPEAWAKRIYEGIVYLDGIEGVPTMDAGPGNCQRVSCSYDSAIYWCNDNLVPLTLQAWRDVAWGAYIIYRQCRDATRDKTSGQVFFLQDWNVVVRGERC